MRMFLNILLFVMMMWQFSDDTIALSCSGQDGNLLRNPGVEECEGQNPSTWFQACLPADGLKMFHDTHEAHSGKASIAIENEHVYDEKVCNNWAQRITHVPKGGKVKLSAFIKTIGAKNVNVCVQCWGTGNKMVAFESTSTYSGDHEWFLAEAKPLFVPLNTNTMIVRAVLTGKGKVWFDDLALTVVADPCEDAGEDMDPSFFPDFPGEALSCLKAFVGDWEGTGNLKVEETGEEMEAKVRRKARLMCDGWGLLSEWEMENPDDPDKKLHGIDIMIWDIHSKVYRTWGFNSRGTHGTGMGFYDREKETWRFSHENYDWHGNVGFSDDIITMPDPDTVKVSVKGWRNAEKTRKFSEYSAVAKRVNKEK